MTADSNYRIRIGFVIAVLFAGVVVYVLLPLSASSWWRHPFPGLVLDPNLVINDTASDDWAARMVQPPVKYPERITAVNGQPVSSNKEFWTRLQTFSPGDVLNITVEQPTNSIIKADGTRPLTRTFTITLTNFSNRDKWNHFWIIYLTGLSWLIGGIWTFWLRPNSEPAQIFALLMAFGSVAIGGLFDLVTSQWVIRIWITALPLTTVWIVWLAGIFPYQTRLFKKHPGIKYILLLLGIIVAIWGQLWLTSSRDPWAYAIPWRAAYALSGLGILTAIAILGHRTFRSPSPLVRQQTRFILIGTFLAFTPVTIAFFSLASNSKAPEWFTPTVYIIPIIIFPIAIGYTIIRYRLLDLEIVLRQGIAFGLLTTILVGAFVLITTGLTLALNPTIDLNNPLILVLYLILVALVFDPLRTKLQQAVDQYFFRQPVAFDELLRAYSRELTATVDADQIAACLIKYAHAGIPEAEPLLFLPDEKVRSFVNYTNGHKPLIEETSPLVQCLKEEDGVVDLAEERVWPEALKTHQAEVKALDAAVLVPMKNGHDLLGWLALTRKSSGQHYTPSEMSYLATLADQSLIGLERANVLRRLQARVTELDTLSQFSQVLNITINMDDLMELVYTSYHRVFQVDDFYIALRDDVTGRLYMAFCVEDDERHEAKEGKGHWVDSPHVVQVAKTGQPNFLTDENGRFWAIAPLNAGAETIGVLYATYTGQSLDPHKRQNQLFTVFADRTAVALERLLTRQNLEEYARQLEIINEITLSLAATLELEPLLNLILDKAIELLNTEAGTFMLTIPDTGELEFRVVRGPASDHLIGKKLPIGTGLAGTAAQTGRPVLVNRVQDDKRWFDKVDEATTFESQSILTVPMLRQNTVLGVLQVINKKDGAPFDENDQTLLMSFASQAVVALENARLLAQTDEALQKRVSELFMLQQLDRDLNTTLDLEHVLNLTLDWALRICKGTAGAVVLLDEEERPYLAASRGYDDSFELLISQSQKIESGLVTRVLKSGQPYVSANVHEESDYIAASFETHSQMTLPIIHKQQLIGALAIESNQLDAFDEEALETAVRMTNHAAVAIANALLYQQVKDANRAKSEFVSMVSHELKTPMTSMRGYTDLILSGMTGPLTDQQRTFLETIAANIRRMSQQIQDLTDISRIETGQLHVEMLPMAFTNVVSDTLQSVRALFEDKKTELHVDLPDDLPVVMADKDRMVQVLINLLSNACKYSPPESDVYLTFKTGEMALHSEDKVEPVVLISVRDTGYGISEEDQKKLFTKFFRADDPNIRKSTGTGLGLSITHGIVELHNGRIWVESELGKGTTFHIALPQINDAGMKRP